MIVMCERASKRVSEDECMHGPEIEIRGHDNAFVRVDGRKDFSRNADHHLSTCNVRG